MALLHHYRYVTTVERRLPTPAELADEDVYVLDVGGVHDPDLNNFDRPRGGAGARPNGVPYATFGLLWDYLCEDYDVLARVDQLLVQPIDAADCGWGTCEGTCPQLGLSAVISWFNPNDPAATAEDRLARFGQAVELAGEILWSALREAQAFVKARAAAS